MPNDDRQQIDQIVGELTALAERGVRKLALDVTTNLAAATPVDTGWARANWIPSIGQPVTSPVGSPGDVGQAATAQTAGLASLLGYRLPASVWISNHVPYIELLNTGSSKQEPAAFVQRAIEKSLAQSS